MYQGYFQCSEPVPLTDGHFKDITFNGVQFLLLDAVNSEIYKYDCNFYLIETVPLNREYTSICYDEHEQCYWALCENSAETIFQLDESFLEMETISMCNAPQCSAQNISYDSCGKTLWVSFSNFVGYTTKDCTSFEFSKNDCDCQSIRSILTLPLCRLIGFSSCNKECIHIYRSNCDKNKIINIPEGFLIEGMCARKSSDSSDCKKYYVYVLLTQIHSHQSFVLYFAVNCPGNCAETCSRNCSCNCSGNCSGNESGNCCCPTPDCIDSCKKELCKIIHSIALEEVGISHILNAEGEKIQRAVACSKTIDELMEVNESVKNTIIQITQLEIQLSIKLESAIKELRRK